MAWRRSLSTPTVRSTTTDRISLTFVTSCAARGSRAATIRACRCGAVPLRHAAARGREVLGLPPVVDHLFDVPPLPAVPRRERRLLRPRPQPGPAPGRRAPRLLGSGRRGRPDERAAAGGARPRIERRQPPPAARTGSSRPARGLRPGRPGRPWPAAPPPARRRAAAATRRHRGGRDVGRSRDALRRARPLAGRPIGDRVGLGSGVGAGVGVGVGAGVGVGVGVGAAWRAASGSASARGPSRPT